MHDLRRSLAAGESKQPATGARPAPRNHMATIVWLSTIVAARVARRKANVYAMLLVSRQFGRCRRPSANLRALDRPGREREIIIAPQRAYYNLLNGLAPDARLAALR